MIVQFTFWINECYCSWLNYLQCCLISKSWEANSFFKKFYNQDLLFNNWLNLIMPKCKGKCSKNRDFKKEVKITFLRSNLLYLLAPTTRSSLSSNSVTIKAEIFTFSMYSSILKLNSNAQRPWPRGNRHVCLVSSLAGNDSLLIFTVLCICIWYVFLNYLVYFNMSIFSVIPK